MDIVRHRNIAAVDDCHHCRYCDEDVDYSFCHCPSKVLMAWKMLVVATFIINRQENIKNCRIISTFSSFFLSVFLYFFHRDLDICEAQCILIIEVFEVCFSNLSVSLCLFCIFFSSKEVKQF